MTKPSRRLNIFVVIVIGLPVLGLLGLTLLAMFAPRSYLGAPFCDVRWTVGLGSAGLALFALLARSFRWAGLAFLLALFHCAPSLWLYFPASSHDADESAEELRVAAANVWIGNTNPAATCDWLVREDVDVVFLCELSLAIRPALLARMEERYPHHRLSPSDPEAWGSKTWGRAMFSRHPIQSWSAIDAHGKVVRATVEIEGEAILIIGAHANKPSPGYGAPLRDEELRRIGLASASDPTTIVLGDLNATTTTPSFRDLLKDGALRDSRQGFGRQSSWFSVRPIRGIHLSLDHILVGDSWIVKKRSVGPAIGSDHRPVFAVLKRRAQTSTAEK